MQALQYCNTICQGNEFTFTYSSILAIHPHTNPNSRLPIRSTADSLVRAPDGTMVPAESLMVGPDESIVSEEDSFNQHNSGVFQQGEFMEVKHVGVDGGDRFSPTAVAFDQEQELVWMGNAGVRFLWVKLIYLDNTLD